MGDQRPGQSEDRLPSLSGVSFSKKEATISFLLLRLSPICCYSSPMSVLPLLFLGLGALQADPGVQGAPAINGPVTIERRSGLMGTALRLSVTAADRPTALAASEAALVALLAAQRRLSTWTEGGELSELNRAPLGAPQTLSPLLDRELTRCAHWWRATAGAFDPALAPLVAAWGLRGRGRLPASAELAAAREASTWQRGRLIEGTFTRNTHQPLLEEGAFGKGAGLAAALLALEQTGAQAALLDLGGQIALHGPGERALHLADPVDRQRPVLELVMTGGSLATSGNSERSSARAAGIRGHILDPRTGQPAATTGSYTVWTPSPLDADCLSTALFVMGPAQAWAWVQARRQNQESSSTTNPVVELIILDWHGDKLRAVATPGFKGRLRALSHDIELTFPLDGEVPWK